MAVNQSKDSLQKSKEDHNELLKHLKAISGTILDYTLLPNTEDLWATFDNLDTGHTIRVHLPTAVIGDGFKFSIAKAVRMYVYPYSGETLADPSDNTQALADQRASSIAVGSKLIYECTTTGEWNCNSSSGTWIITGP